MRKIRLLAIAPSESIQNQLCEIALSRQNIILDTFVANLYSAVEIMHQQCRLNDYDAILSRGETASMIKESTDIPVVEFPISAYDVLAAIKLADNFKESYAIVGFSAVTQIALVLNDLLQLNLEIFTLNSLNDAGSVMELLQNKGYRLIISGMGIEKIARRNGINSINITNGYDSLNSAIDQAVRLCSSITSLKQREYFLQQLIDSCGFDLLLFDQNNELVYSNLKKITKQAAMLTATRQLQSSQRCDSVNIKTKNNVMTTIHEKNIQIEGAPYTLFMFEQQKAPYVASKNEIRYFSRDQAIDVFLSHFMDLHNSVPSFAQIAKSPSPVLLLGETGVGKEQIAASIFAKGSNQNKPYLIVDFELASEKTLNYLYNNINSPLNNEGTTIYFRALEKLPPAKIEKLRTILFDSATCKRNKVIFSYSSASDTELPVCLQNLMGQLSCLSVSIPPLRNRTDEIQSLASLYISTANMDLAKQVTGFSPQAMALMEQYTWPGNLIQFKKVINQLVASSVTPQIPANAVEELLKSESRIYDFSSNISALFDLNRPLHSIEKDIVKAVLKEVGGNQSQAALRLGICRTTLWKLLKD